MNLCKRFLVSALAVSMAAGIFTNAYAEEDGPGGPGVSETETEAQAGTEGQEGQAAGELSQLDEAGWAYREETINYPNVNAVYQYVEGDKIRNVRFFLNGVDGTIVYRTTVRAGDQTVTSDWDMNGEQNGVPIGGHHVDGIQIGLAQTAANFYDVWYRCTMKNAGVLGWAVNGEKAGAPNTGDYMTNIEVMLLPKGSPAPGDTANAYYSVLHDRFTRNEAGFFYSEPGVEIFTGWLDDGKNKYYVSDNSVQTGWAYIDGMKFFFREDGTLMMDVDELIGKQPSYLIKINKQMNCLTIYAKDGDKGYIIPVKAMLTSVGDDTPLGTFKTPEKYRWRQMVTGAYSQYATRIKAGSGFLLHSVIYEVPDNKTLWTGTYNELGVARSLGCVRLTTVNAKWIYDNCPIGTSITIYNDPVASPFYKPEIMPIPNVQFWDPTDPNVTF